MDGISAASAQQIAFLVSTLVTLVVVHLRPGPGEFGLEALTTRLRALWGASATSAGLITGAALGALFAVVIVVAVVSVGFLVSTLLGVAVGLLIRALMGTTSARESHYAATICYLVLILVASAFGMYRAPIESFFATYKIGEIGTSGISFQLHDRPGLDLEDQNIDLSATSDGRSDRSELLRETNYRFGVKAMQSLLDNVTNDHERIRAFCGLDQTGKCERDAEMRRLLDDTSAFFAELAPIIRCMQTHADIFPNGLPIQDELSEMAVSFALDDIAIREARSEHVRDALTRIIDHLDLHRRLASADPTPPEPTSPDAGDEAPCELKNAEHYWERLSEYSYNEHVFKSPHRALLESFIIMAAGYPYDAAWHLRKYQQRFQHYWQQVEQQGSSETLTAFQRLHKAIYEVRILNWLEQIYGYSGEFVFQSGALAELRTAYRELFESFDSLLGTDLTRYVVGAELAHALVLACPYTIRAPARLEMAPEELNLFVELSLYTLLASENRRWSAETHNPFPNPAELVDWGSDLGGIFLDDQRFFSCFETWRDRSRVQSASLASPSPLGLGRRAVTVADEQLREQLIVIGVNAAQITARAIEEKHRGADGVSLDATVDRNRELFCAAVDLLDRVQERLGPWGRAAEAPSSASAPWAISWVERERARARDLRGKLERFADRCYAMLN